MQEGLYKVEFHTAHGIGSGVIYAISGKLRGGNSAFTYIGQYSGQGDQIQVKVSTDRYNDDPSFQTVFGTDRVTLTLRGRENGQMVDFEGSALQLPGVSFRAVLTRLSD